jgi:hypothetical protein
MNRGSGKLLNVVLSVALLVQSIACGTLLHPERKGQRDGRIDAGIAVLDALGLLLFIIPGVIAFAVDFSNGTIYLPPESRRSFHAKDLRRVSFDPKQSTPADLEAILEAETGRTIKLDPINLQVVEVKTLGEVAARIGELGDGVLASRPLRGQATAAR